MRFRTLAFLLLIATVIGCPDPRDRTAQRTLLGSAIEHPPAMRGPAPPALVTITDLRGPECVLYDPQQDVYFISNVNGSMLAIDNNGFISRVDAKTMKVALGWVQGGRSGVQLDAPKGMGIVGDTLYVSDIRGVRRFDRRTGAQLPDVPLPGATFINDIASDGKSVYVSDTGVSIGPGVTFLNTGTDAIWRISGDRAEKIAQGADLEHPNGLDFIGGKLHVVTFGSNEVYELDGSKRGDGVKLPVAQLDGLTHLPDGTMLVSSWKGDGIYRSDGDEFHALLSGMDAPADLTYDATHHRLLVPQPFSNQVNIYSIR